MVLVDKWKCVWEKEKEGVCYRKSVWQKRAKVCMCVWESCFLSQFLSRLLLQPMARKKTAKRWSWILNNVRFLKWRQIVGSSDSKGISFKINFSKKYGKRKSFFFCDTFKMKIYFFLNHSSSFISFELERKKLRQRLA